MMDMLFRRTRMTKLTPRPRNALLSLHIAAAVGVLGADLALLTLALSGLYSSALLIAEWVVEPLAVTALGSGLFLATLGPYGVVRYWWTAVKLAITAVLTGAVFLVLTPGLERAAEGGANPQPATLLLAPALATALLLTNVALAVFKPAASIKRPHLRTAKQKEIPT
jgi:hypothetical protein